MAVIFGLGFTGSRLARRLLRRPRSPEDGAGVFAAVRGVSRFPDLAAEGLRLSELALDCKPPLAPELPHNRILVSLIPPLPEPENSALREVIRNLAPKRVVYVSSTGVYGDQAEVDQDTPAKPNEERGRLRLEEEDWIASGPWSSLILRAAAIYGPGRGVHVALREGKLPRGAGSGMVSRIHVDDLARIVEAGIFSDIEGVWPVADDAPCPSLEIVQWCAESLGLAMAAGQNITGPGAAAPLGRKVDGRKIRQILRVPLQYPSWRAGIEASIAEENAAVRQGV